MLRRYLWQVILALVIIGQSLAGCCQLSSFISVLPRTAPSQDQTPLVAPTNPGADIISAPADWVLYQARRYNYGFYHPPGWQVSSEGTSRVLLVGRNGESFVLVIVQAQCGLGGDDASEESILNCLADSGEAAASVGGEGYLLAKDWQKEQGRWIYAFTYAVSSAFSRSNLKQYLLASALPEHKMLIGLYEAPVIGPRTRSELRLLMASFRYGRVVAQIVTPTPLPSPSVDAATPQPRVTLPAAATIQPVIIPSGWIESNCLGCGIIFFRPSTWDLVREESDHMLLRAPDNELVLVGTTLPLCDMSIDVDPERALACLTNYRSQQAPENADYELLDNGYSRESQGVFYWIEYRSSTPDDARPVYGLVIYGLLADNQMLSVEYASVLHLPDAAMRVDAYILANAVRVGKALVVTATPSPQATPRPALTGRASPAWQEPLWSAKN